MKTHVSRMVSSYFAVLRQIRSIRRSVSQQNLQSHSLLLTRLDYGNATLAGVASNQLYTEVWPHHTAAPWPSLAMSATVDRVQTRCACFPLPAWYVSAILARELCRVADMDSHRRLCSIRCSSCTFTNVGDRTFEVSAGRFWNGLPSDVITSPFAITDRLQMMAEDTALQLLVWSVTVLIPVLIPCDTVVGFIFFCW